MQKITSQLQRDLWQRYGSEAHPSEWDGKVFGGGRISQRFWEYFITLKLLDLPKGARVLDIGGGSPQGLGFFSQLLADRDIETIVLDIHSASTLRGYPNVTMIEGLADRQTLTEVIGRHRPSHIACISVLEHATNEQQKGIFEAIETAFDGERFVCTLEFHERTTYFEQQLTTATLSAALRGLERYFLTEIEQSPMHCVNAFSNPSNIAADAGNLDSPVRLWRPLALGFSKSNMPF